MYSETLSLEWTRILLSGITHITHTHTHIHTYTHYTYTYTHTSMTHTHTHTHTHIMNDTQVQAGLLPANPTLSPDAAEVDAVVSTIGFPLVGGPAGSMEGARQAELAKEILMAKNVPYFVAAPLLIQVHMCVCVYIYIYMHIYSNEYS